MIENTKPIESLTVADLEARPVWQYTNKDGAGETLVQPVKKIPVKDLTGKVIGTQVRFADGTRAWALIGNVDVANPRVTEHFLTLSIERESKWFALARYHDHDYADRGPDALCRFLDLQARDVFPIGADIRPYVQGDPAALVISVPKEAQEKLTRADLIALVSR